MRGFSCRILFSSIALVSFKYSTVENVNDVGNLLSVSQLQNPNLRICSFVFDDVSLLEIKSQKKHDKVA
jgi:hypothetical protein